MDDNVVDSWYSLSTGSRQNLDTDRIESFYIDSRYTY